MSFSLFNYSRRFSHEVTIGEVRLGGTNPVRLQSMTTPETINTKACVEQIHAIVDAGGELVRLTTQGLREVDALREIKHSLKGSPHSSVPLVADVHFNPAVADFAAITVEKVRINPGNYVDPARTFKHLEYTEEEYNGELARLEARFKQLLALCKEHGTALRIGVNHGSLSDRIMSRYGDTPEGIVESCMEFLRICQRETFNAVVVSIKASNTVVMVQSVRQLCLTMKNEGMTFPIHLGVTEAGEGEDGRIKSACGIGALLADGIGDTIRVSLSEAPEREIPVARQIRDYIALRTTHPIIHGELAPNFCFESPTRRPTRPIRNIGGNNVPIVVSRVPKRVNFAQSFSKDTPDYFLYGDLTDGRGRLVKPSTQIGSKPDSTDDIPCLYVSLSELTGENIATLRQMPELVVIAHSSHKNRVGELRAIVHRLWKEGITNPVVISLNYPQEECLRTEAFQIKASADCGPLLFDGLVDGLMLSSPVIEEKNSTETAFAILQATRQRTTRTEYISCPGCGRTLYDLPETIARIKQATSHLVGLKIGIMGCIVNGPGEMADADYGYVGAGRGRISLYRGKDCVEKNIPTELAVEKLLALIEKDHPTEVR